MKSFEIFFGILKEGIENEIFRDDFFIAKEVQ